MACLSTPNRSTLRTLPSLGSLLAVALALTGCGDGSGTSTYTLTDSAGVTIVQNTGALTEGRPLSGEPTLTIGTVDGDENYQLFQVAGMHRLDDGRIGIVNAGSRQVRLYGPDGVFLSAFGQRGDGPEEFQMPVLAGTFGDTLIVVDRAHHRLTFVHPDLGIVGIARIANDVGGYLNPVGSFANGHTVFGGAFDMRRTGELKTGMNRAGTFYRSSDLTGALAADFGDKDGAEFFIKDIESDGPEARPTLTPFAKVPVGAVSPQYFFFSSQDQYEIEVFNDAGALVRLIRYDLDPIPVTSADGQAHIESMVARVGNPEQAAGMRSQMGELPLPAFFPPHAGILADDLDHLWVQDFQRPGAENRTWTVFDENGVLVDRVTLPDRFSPIHIGADFVLGLGWDEMNVEYVRMFPLTR